MAWGSTTAEAWSATDLDSWSATTQRGVQKTDEFLDELELDESLALAKENGHQEGNLNAGLAVRAQEINRTNPFWKMTDEEIIRDNITDPTTISFNTSAFARDENDKDTRENTDFIERGDRPLCSVVKIVQASIGKELIWPIVAHINNKFKVSAMDLIMEEILETLEAGKVYRFNNSSSLKLRSSRGSIDAIKSSYVLFRYIVGLPPLTFHPPPKPKPGENRIKLAEAEKELDRLLEEAKDKSKPNIVRQASRSVYFS
jgi:hypothetical protein